MKKNKVYKLTRTQAIEALSGDIKWKQHDTRPCTWMTNHHGYLTIVTYLDPLDDEDVWTPKETGSFENLEELLEKHHISGFQILINTPIGLYLYEDSVYEVVS